MVTHGADPIFRLPIPASLDRGPRMACVVDAVTEQFMSGLRGRDWQFDGLSEQEPELRATRSLGCRDPTRQRDRSVARTPVRAQRFRISAPVGSFHPLTPHLRENRLARNIG